MKKIANYCKQISDIVKRANVTPKEELEITDLLVKIIQAEEERVKEFNAIVEKLKYSNVKMGQ